MPSLTVEDPKITHVQDLVQGMHLPVQDVIGCDYAETVQLRSRIKTAQLEKEPLYACSVCSVPVYLLRHHKSKHFFFRHETEDQRCPAKTRGELSQKEINARRYDGIKESLAHIHMKKMVIRSLEADPRFSNIQYEKRWAGKLTERWRKPDVSAVYDDGGSGGPIKVAFEVQLSTTYLDVIAERRLFYLKENALLFWVFAEFNDMGRRLMQDDIFYNNNQNAFVVTKQTVALSMENKAFHVDCRWYEPMVGGGSSPLKQAFVSFHELRIERSTQRAFRFDYEAALAALAPAISSEHTALRSRFEQYWLRRHEEMEVSVWRVLQVDFKRVGIILPDYCTHLPTHLLNMLYSAKYGRNIGWDFSTFIQLAHWIVAAYKRHLEIFRIALGVYGRGGQLVAEDHTGKWLNKVKAYKKALKSGDPAFTPDTSHDALVCFLFPELFDNKGKRLLLHEKQK